MATMVYAVESWMLALISWAWLSFQEMWAWSLLSAHVFYGVMLLSTMNVVASGMAPENTGPRAAYFGAMLAFTLHSACCILDTLPMPAMGNAFQSPVNATTCTLARSNQLYFFSDTPFYLVQAGATLGYLVLQLVVSGAGLLDSELRTLWPGPTWGSGLAMLLCGRLISTFDGMARGVSGQSKYLEIFSLPVVEFAFLFYLLMYLLGILGLLEGLMFPGLGWRKSVRFVEFPTLGVFFVFVLYVTLTKGLLTPALLVLLLLLLLVAVTSLIEAVLAQPLQIPTSALIQPPQNQPLPAVWNGRPTAPVFQWPPGPAPAYAQPRQGPPMRTLRHVIPSPVEMLSEKNKRL
jgi:hypothetical protein